MKNNKGIAPILIVLTIIMVLAFGGIYYFLINNSKKSVEKVDETADWKTYRSEEYGFKVKYPNNWHAEFGDLTDLSAKLFINFGSYPFNESYGRDDYIFVNLVVDETPALDDYLNEMKKYGAKIEETNIASNKAYKIITTGEEVYSGNNLNPSISITITHNNYMYGFLILYPNEISEKVFNQIVSTFKFLD